MSDTTNPKDALGVRKAPLRFVPPALAIIASDALADGALKYGAYNWRKTEVRMSVYLEAIERHLLALKDGQDCAEDSGHLHLAHIAACCAIIADAAVIDKLIDDRPIPGPGADMLRWRDKTQHPADEGLTPEQLDRILAYTLGDPQVNEAAVLDSEGEPEPFTGTPATVLAQDLVGAQVRVLPGWHGAPEPFTGTPATVLAQDLVGAQVRVLPGWHGAPAGLVGTVRSVVNDFLNVETPGVRSGASDGLWRFLGDEIEVLG